MWLSLPVCAAAEPAEEATVFNRGGMLRPILLGRAEKDPRTVLIDTQEGGCLSEDARVAQGGVVDKCWFSSIHGRVCSKQSILSRSQAAATFSFPFKTLLSTSWNISPEYRRE